jgi:uncharacterized membrane protein
MRRFILMSLALALSACSAPPPPEPRSPELKVLAGVNLDGPISVLGTEPFWSLTLKADDITLESPDLADRRFARVAFEKGEQSDHAELISDALSLSLTAKTCSDGMSDRVYPLTAEVNINDISLKGCAIDTETLNDTKP